MLFFYSWFKMRFRENGFWIGMVSVLYSITQYGVIGALDDNIYLRYTTEGLKPGETEWWEADSDEVRTKYTGPSTTIFYLTSEGAPTGSSYSTDEWGNLIIPTTTPRQYTDEWGFVHFITDEPPETSTDRRRRSRKPRK